MNKHSKSGIFNYHSEIWADKAGYYIYLPTLFDYNFDANSFPDSIAKKTGYGFIIDTINNKILTKYTYGVALLQSPFYLIAKLLTNNTNEIKGFTVIHHKLINIAAIFYLLAGLIFLYKYLLIHFSHKVSLLTILTIFFGTNLFHYSIDETGMSHVYSFALFSIFIFTSKDILTNTKPHIGLLLGLLSGIIVIIRPTNIIFLISVIILHTYPLLIKFRNQNKSLFSLYFITPYLFGFGLAILPQLIYWKYVFGSLVSYSYGNDGFNWLKPLLHLTWFSPNNGLFLYTPLILAIIIGIMLLIIKNRKEGLIILLLFIVLSYILSCWNCWSFGRSLGARSYVEYYSIFAIPVAFLYTTLGKTSTPMKIISTLFILVLVAINIKITYTFDECFYGAIWDWSEYLNLLFEPTK